MGIMEKEEDDKKWHLIRNNNGEWVRDEHAVFLDERATVIYKVRAARYGIPLSKQTGSGGAVWFYKHEIEKINAATVDAYKTLESKGLIIKHRTAMAGNISKGVKNEEAYYDRRMSEAIKTLLTGKFKWLIEYVYDHKELDFQTGKTWFSIYRGTGRILTLKSDGTIFADTKYMELNPDFYRSPTVERFNALMERVIENKPLNRYYIGTDGKKKEGYYQTLIARRYSLHCQPEDNFVIFDKEFVIGYKDDGTREKWQAVAKGWAKEKIKWAKENNIPGEIKIPGSECDFVGITKDGDLLLMELKRCEDTSKIRLSPLQIGHYDELTRNFMEKYYNSMNSSVNGMIEQKIWLGLIFPAWRDFPSKLSGKIKLAVVVGGKASRMAIEGFKEMKRVVGKDITYYTCDESTGTLIQEAW